MLHLHMYSVNIKEGKRKSMYITRWVYSWERAYILYNHNYSRKTLRISEAQFVAFHFHCSLQSCLLRVIDNDTMTEMPRVFQRTTPCIYTPNHKGYTLQAEAWVPGVTTSVSEVDDRKWKLLAITSNKERPPVLNWNTEDREEEETFIRQEIVDYCLPNREEVLFRSVLYTPKVISHN